MRPDRRHPRRRRPAELGYGRHRPGAGSRAASCGAGSSSLSRGPRGLPDTRAGGVWHAGSLRRNTTHLKSTRVNGKSQDGAHGLRKSVRKHCFVFRRRSMLWSRNRTARRCTMLAAERRAQILDTVRRDGVVRAADLVQEFGVSLMTVRRDLDALAGNGLIDKVHGGATVRTAPPPEPEGAATAAHPLQLGVVVPTAYYFRRVVNGMRDVFDQVRRPVDADPLRLPRRRRALAHREPGPVRCRRAGAGTVRRQRRRRLRRRVAPAGGADGAGGTGVAR